MLLTVYCPEVLRPDQFSPSSWLSCHVYVSASPVAEILKLVAVPSHTVSFTGSWVISGANCTSRVAGLLVTDPQSLLATHTNCFWSSPAGGV